MTRIESLLAIGVPLLVGAFVTLLVLYKSLHRIGPTEVGLVRLNFSPFSKGSDPCAIAFNGEAGYQAKLLQRGLRFRPWPLYSVTKHPWVQIPPDSVGVIDAQIGKDLPQGRKNAVYNPAFGDFTDLKAFLENGGEKGIQRQLLQPGTTVPLHPIAFVVLSTRGVFGIAIDDEGDGNGKRDVTLGSYGITADQLRLTTIDKVSTPSGPRDAIGVVTILDGDALEPGQIASRLGGWDDVERQYRSDASDADIMDVLLRNSNARHKDYQDMQAFFEAGGRIGLQHDPLMPGRYSLNPFLVKVEVVPMLEVQQGQVAVVKAFTGLRAVDESGTEFKHGQIVRPGRRGVWREPLRTGKFPINPRLYEVEIVPTAILTLNWSKRTGAHGLDKELASVSAKSREGFNFLLDLQVQLHVADGMAPFVISAVGTVQNLVQEVMRPAVGSFFRGKLQSTSATDFIESREAVQGAATEFIRGALHEYRVEVKGVFMQEMELPAELVAVLTEREIANQQKLTLARQREAQLERATYEAERGKADAQHELARTGQQVAIAKNAADAMKAAADGEAHKITKLGEAEASRVRNLGTAQADGYRAQTEAIGRESTTLVNVANAVRDGHVKIMPDILVVGGGGGLDGLAATLMGNLSRLSGTKPNEIPPHAKPGQPVGQAGANGNGTIDAQLRGFDAATQRG